MEDDEGPFWRADMIVLLEELVCFGEADIVLMEY
jgi:hypothetical protein